MLLLALLWYFGQILKACFVHGTAPFYWFTAIANEICCCHGTASPFTHCFLVLRSAGNTDWGLDCGFCHLLYFISTKDLSIPITVILNCLGADSELGIR